MRWLCLGFLYGAAACLLLTGFAKLTTSIGESSYLGRRDVLLWFMTNRQLMFVASVFELAAGWFILGRSRLAVVERVFIVCWIAMVFLVYRVGLLWVGYRETCNCAGDLWSWIGLSQNEADFLMLGILGYLCLSYCFLAALVARPHWFGEDGCARSACLAGK